VPKVAVASAFVLYLFSPFTLDMGWTRILREPISTVVLVATGASLLFLVAGLMRGYIAKVHLVMFSVLIAFGALIREEDILLFLIPIGAGALIACGRPRLEGTPGSRLRQAFVIAFVPLLLGLAAHMGARAFVGHHYGGFLLHDFGEGEFPRMIAAMRSVVSRRDNRYVMISQEALNNLAREVPRLRPVVRRLPPPGRSTVSCQWLGICSEWANGWLPFWIKDAAYLAGLTPDLRSAQAYFQAVREDIEAACIGGRLTCVPKGEGLVPPFELRWTRAFVGEARNILRHLLLPDWDERQSLVTEHGPKVEEAFASVTRSAVSSGPRSQDDTAHMYQAPWIERLRPVYNITSVALITCALGTCLAALWVFGGLPPNPLSISAAVLGAYLLARLIALAYLAVYMGRYDLRMMMSSHILLVSLSPCIIAVALGFTRKRKNER
jgi:hypothetical protein